MVETGTISTEDNVKISYRWHKNGHQAVTVIVHGFFNSKESVLLKELEEHLCERQDVYIFDLRGHGQSSGLFTWTSRESTDLEAVLKFLGGLYGGINVVAFSMGGSVSINVLSGGRHNISSLVCVSAPCDCAKIDFKWWSLSIENDILYSLLSREGRTGKGVKPGPFWLSKNKPIDNVNKLKIPVLYIHGDRDWVVGVNHSRELYERTRAPKKFIVIPGGPHAEYLMRGHKNRLLAEMDAWINARRG